MSTSNLDEIGPDDERWWAFERQNDDGTIKHGSYTALMFLTLEEIQTALAYFNEQNGNLYKAFLATERPLTDPMVYPYTPWRKG